MAVFREQLVVSIHEFALADSGGSLFCRHVCRLLSKPKLAHAHPDCAGGDKNYFVPCVFEVAEHLAERFHLADVQSASRMRDGGGADFDDNAHTDVPSSVSC